LLLSEWGSSLLLGAGRTGALLGAIGSGEFTELFLGQLAIGAAQGAVAGYGTYAIGRAAQAYLERGCTWGTDGPDTVIRDILKHLDRHTILYRLRQEFGRSFLSWSSQDVHWKTEFVGGLTPYPVFLIHFSQNIMLQSQCGIDYSSIQELLIQQEFQAADQLTLQKMCELAGPSAEQRKWLYFTEVDNFPSLDLQTLDELWRYHSEGKFGFSSGSVWAKIGSDSGPKLAGRLATSGPVILTSLFGMWALPKVIYHSLINWEVSEWSPHSSIILPGHQRNHSVDRAD
jgi:GUN4-like/Domain of unknown function (DUF697)